MDILKSNELQKILEEHPSLQKFITQLSHQALLSDPDSLALLAGFAYYLGRNDGMARVLKELFNHD